MFITLKTVEGQKFLLNMEAISHIDIMECSCYINLLGRDNYYIISSEEYEKLHESIMHRYYGT